MIVAKKFYKLDSRRTIESLRVGMSFFCSPDETNRSALDNMQQKLRKEGIKIKIVASKSLKGGWTITRLT